MTVEGIDISHHQSQTPPLGTSLGFVFVRATYGLSPDDKYAMHAKNVLEAGKIQGAYHFGRYGDGATQARAFLNVIGPTVKLVALDYERDGNNPHMTPDQARAFIRTVQATGRTCGLYASESGYPTLGQDWKWVANWGNEPAGLYAFWQYAVNGTPRIDRDRFSGTMDQLRVLAGLPVGWRYVNKPTPPAITKIFDQFVIGGGGVITEVSKHMTRGMNVPCSAPKHFEAAPGKPAYWARDLVQLHVPGKKRDRWWVDARFAHKENA